MPYRILLRRDTSTNWDYNNPVLMLGEPGFESDTGRLKIGDGQSPWKDLGYTLGNTGPSGNNGENGATGEMGPTGISGPQGSTGAQGETGPQGATGPQGQYTVNLITSSTGILSFDKIYNGVDYTGGTSGITLPIGTSPDDEGKFLIVADESGSISGFNKGIYVNSDGGQTINGNPSILMKIDYMSLTFLYANSNWKII